MTQAVDLMGRLQPGRQFSKEETAKKLNHGGCPMKKTGFTPVFSGQCAGPPVRR